VIRLFKVGKGYKITSKVIWEPKTWCAKHVARALQVGLPCKGTKVRSVNLEEGKMGASQHVYSAKW